MPSRPGVEGARRRDGAVEKQDDAGDHISQGFDTKSIMEPTEQYVVRKVLVVAKITTLDKHWKTIAEHVIGHENGNLSKKLVDDVSLKGHMLETLFITLLQSGAPQNMSKKCSKTCQKKFKKHV